MKFDLKELVPKDFSKTNEEMFFLRIKIKSLITDTKIQYGGKTKVEFEYLDESYNRYYKIVNALAKSILSQWEQ